MSSEVREENGEGAAARGSGVRRRTLGEEVGEGGRVHSRDRVESVVDHPLQVPLAGPTCEVVDEEEGGGGSAQL